jgi:hypothetical protein
MVGRVFVLVALTVIAGLGTASLPRYWARTPRLDARINQLRRNKWGHMDRAIAPAVGGLWCFVVAGIYAVLGRDLDSAVGLPLVIVLLGSIVSVNTIMLFNRPAFLVPPGYRREPGIVSLRLSSRRT